MSEPTSITTARAARKSRASRGTAQDAQDAQDAKPPETTAPAPVTPAPIAAETPKPKPVASMDLGARPVTMYYPTVTLPSGEKVECSHTAWGHRTEAAGLKCARQMAAAHSAKLA